MIKRKFKCNAWFKTERCNTIMSVYLIRFNDDKYTCIRLDEDYKLPN